MSGQFWEPWQPQVGDRVRVMLSPECRAVFRSRWADSRQLMNAPSLTHIAGEDGRVGTVIDIEHADEDIAPGHIYLTQFDRPVFSSAVGLFAEASTFAAVELEPLDGAS